MIFNVLFAHGAELWRPIFHEHIPSNCKIYDLFRGSAVFYDVEHKHVLTPTVFHVLVIFQSPSHYYICCSRRCHLFRKKKKNQRTPSAKGRQINIETEQGHSLSLSNPYQYVNIPVMIHRLDVLRLECDGLQRTLLCFLSRDTFSPSHGQNHPTCSVTDHNIRYTCRAPLQEIFFVLFVSLGLFF